MSSFRGRLVDPVLSFITMDYFGEEVYDCDLFLLSHHHCDHMKGIFSDELGRIINESTAKLVYCSPLTAHFLRKNRKCHVHPDKIRQMELCKPVVLEQDRIDTHVVITSLPAAHCAGSIMFLIECGNKRILYSGDIRLTLSDLKNIIGTVTNVDGSLITIDDLYLDTTFAVSTELKDFPPREKSEQTIIDLIKQHMSISPNGKVVLDIGARFGYESLFIEVCKALKMPVMFHDHAMVYYDDIEQIRDYITSHARCGDDGWRVHACLNYSRNKCELVKSTVPVKVLKPCALGFVKYSNDHLKMHGKYRVPYLDQPDVTKVFYATHCSLNELRDMYAFLKPKRVFPSVKGGQSIKTILESIGVQNKKQTRVEPRLSPRHPKREREEYEQPRLELKKRLKLTLID